MSMGKAIVATKKAAEGIHATDGTHLMVEDTSFGFAEKILRLLEDSEERHQFGRSARNFVESHYDWSTNINRLGDIVFGATG